MPTHTSRRTVLYERHIGLTAKMVEFAGWNMPLHFAGGIIREHLATRKTAGLFDVSHMGRFIIRGPRALDFLQHVLTNNAAALKPGLAQYTIIPDSAGGAIDDAYLYRFIEHEYLLVVNAANAAKDWDYFQSHLSAFDQVELIDQTDQLAMLSLQGPLSKQILSKAIDVGQLPEPRRNSLSTVTIDDSTVLLSRTGYTGEPLCFELFVAAQNTPKIWDLLIELGSVPVGLGARDTLRLEASLPLYGHEFGSDPQGKPIPIFACSLAKFAVSFSPLKGNFLGRDALARQHSAYKSITSADYSLMQDLPRMIFPLALNGKSVARAGAKVFSDQDQHVGFVTSGTMVPYWIDEGQALASRLTQEKAMRPICLALLDSDLRPGQTVLVEIRNKKVPAFVVPFNLRSEAPPFARAIIYETAPQQTSPPATPIVQKVRSLLDKTIENTRWRQSHCLNLIPSEQTASPMARLLSVMDPAFRYAEHKSVKAFKDAQVFYYQGTDFICEVESMLADELSRFLGCSQVETRPISGQMANVVVFSAMVDFLNRASRKAEPRRIRSVMNNDIIKGGHLSAQPMGALRDYVARDPKTESPAVVNFPVLAENPYKIDVAACKQLIAEHRPELFIFGKSVVLHPEPIAQIRAFVDEINLDCVIMYDMAHVLGLVGPHFQEPFKEGADLVTGSTHKTFFGTQRGIVAGNFLQQSPMYDLWEAIERRSFPGAVSNHHLGSMLGLLMATYEMNHFKDEYQQAVLANAKAFALALKENGLDVAGDPSVSYTQTHQVIVNVGYAKGPELARRFEENNIILNYQIGPQEEGFSASGCLRMGVSEMTRFGMTPADFQQVAQLIRDVVIDGTSVKQQVKEFRKNFLDLKYCFSDSQYDELLQQLHSLI